MAKMTNSDILKKQMSDALHLSLGIVTKACEAVGISRQTHYRWLEEDKAYKEICESISEVAIDHVESKLFEKINGVTISKGVEIYEVPPSDTAIIFYLKTKGKRRGYVEKTETDLSLKGNLHLSDEEITFE